MDKQEIIKVRKDSNGNITDVMLSDGNECTIKQAISMAKEGLIGGVHVVKPKKGKEYLRTNRNETDGDNLDSLALF
ncbi:DUF3892 domain-containing protein [Anaeromicrobium sp.]|uniref:DUF3892 domain-containing protein n=1 Tax=Anaeromicrobium sp. TaxID=1929132 RepID=UPI002ED6803D